MWNLSFYLCLCFTTENFTVNRLFDLFFRFISWICHCFFFLHFGRKLHGTSADIDDEEAGSNQSLDDDDQPSVKSDESHENQLDGEISGRNKKEFLKDLEKSLRTGRPIKPEGEGEVEQNSPSDPSNYFPRWIRKCIR